MRGAALVLLSLLLCLGQCSKVVDMKEEDKEFSQIPLRVAAALGLGARGVPVTMALTELLGPGASPNMVHRVRQKVLELMKRLHSQPSASANIMLVDAPSIVAPLGRLVDILSPGWSGLLSNATQRLNLKAAEKMYHPRSREDLLVSEMGAFQSVDHYAKKAEDALKSARKAVQGRERQLRIAHRTQLIQIFVAEQSGELKEKLSEEVDDQVLAEFDKQAPLPVNTAEFKSFWASVQKDRQSTLKPVLERAHQGIDQAQQLQMRTISQVGRLVIAQLKNKIRYSKHQLSAVRRMVKQGTVDGAISFRKAMAILSTADRLVLAGQQLNVDEARFYSTTEALLGAYSAALGALTRQISRDVLRLATDGTAESAVDEHVLMLHSLGTELSNRILAESQAVFDRTLAVKAVARANASHPHVNPKGADPLEGHVTMESVSFDRALVQDLPSISRAAQLALDVSSMAVAAKDTLLADGICALSAQLRALAHSLKHNRFHRIGASDRHQASIFGKVLDREIFDSQTNAVHSQHARLIQELKKLAGGFYGGVPSAKEAGADAARLSTEVSQWDNAKAAASRAREIDHDLGARLLESASQLPLSAPTESPDSASSWDGVSGKVLTERIFGLIQRVRRAWRRNRWLAANYAIGGLARVAKSLSVMDAAKVEGLDRSDIAQQLGRLASRALAVVLSSGGNEPQEVTSWEIKAGRASAGGPRLLSKLFLQAETRREESDKRNPTLSQPNGVNLFKAGKKLVDDVVEDHGVVERIRDGEMHRLPGVGSASALQRAAKKLIAHPGSAEYLKEAGELIDGSLGRRIAQEASESESAEGVNRPSELSEDRMRSVRHVTLFRKCTDSKTWESPDAECAPLMKSICSLKGRSMTPTQFAKLCAIEIPASEAAPQKEKSLEVAPLKQMNEPLVLVHAEV